jgi:hypothetical protein
LLLPSGEFLWLALAQVGEPHGADRVIEPGAVNLVPAQQERQRDVLFDREVWQEVVGLKDEAQVITAELCQALWLELRNLGRT